MNSRPELRLDWCSHDAAKYACEKWHYSKCMPAGKLVKIGVWENKIFIGTVIFGRGANNNIGGPYGLEQTEICELVRVALRGHQTPVSRIIAISIKLLRKQSPGLRLILSYADPSQGHHGGIYQAGGWLCAGRTPGGTHMLQMPDGTILHKRSVTAKYGHADSKVLGGKYVYPEKKHVYLMPLDDEMRSKISGLAKPYPKRAKQAMAEDPSAQRQSITDPHAPIST